MGKKKKVGPWIVVDGSTGSGRAASSPVVGSVVGVSSDAAVGNSGAVTKAVRVPGLGDGAVRGSVDGGKDVMGAKGASLSAIGEGVTPTVGETPLVVGSKAARVSGLGDVRGSVGVGRGVAREKAASLSAIVDGVAPIGVGGGGGSRGATGVVGGVGVLAGVVTGAAGMVSKGLAASVLGSVGGSVLGSIGGSVQPASASVRVGSEEPLDVALQEGVGLERDVLSDEDADGVEVSPAAFRAAASVLSGRVEKGAVAAYPSLGGHVGTSASVPMSFADVVKEGGARGSGFGGRPIARAASSKKVYMNAGLGGKLAFSPPTSNRVAIKVTEGLPMHEVWGWSLLGQYVGYQPNHYMIVNMMNAWGVKVRYRVEEGWMFFQFDSEADQEKVLRGGPYFIYGKPMILTHIPDKFAFNRKDIATIPLWVRLFGLPKTFWTPVVLGRIASHVGKPLFMDSVTDCRKRGAYARVLVEINFAETVTRGVSLDFDDGDSIECSFLIENEPLYCKSCCSFGHDVEGCSFKEKKVSVGINTKRVPLAAKKVVKGTKIDEAEGVTAAKVSAEDSVLRSPVVGKGVPVEKIVDGTVVVDEEVESSSSEDGSENEDDDCVSLAATSDNEGRRSGSDSSSSDEEEEEEGANVENAGEGKDGVEGNVSSSEDGSESDGSEHRVEEEEPPLVEEFPKLKGKRAVVVADRDVVLGRKASSKWPSGVAPPRSSRRSR